MQAAYASEITTDADYAYEDARYEDAVTEAEDMGDALAAAREMAYASETSKNADDDESAKSDDDDAFRVAWSGAAAATARVEREGQEGLRPPELRPPWARARARVGRGRLRRRDAAGAARRSRRVGDGVNSVRRRVDLNGWALDDSSEVETRFAIQRRA